MILCAGSVQERKARTGQTDNGTTVDGYHPRQWPAPTPVLAPTVFQGRRRTCGLVGRSVFFQMAAEYTDDEFRGFVYDAPNFYFTAPLLFANGGYVFKQTNEGLDANDIGLNNEGALKGAEFFKGLYGWIVQRWYGYGHYQRTMGN